MFLWLIFTEQEKRDRFRHFITCQFSFETNLLLHSIKSACITLLYKRPRDQYGGNIFLPLSSETNRGNNSNRNENFTVGNLSNEENEAEVSRVN